MVLTGRDRPSAQWRADAGWRELVEVIPLGNLAEAEASKLLLDRGVSAKDCGPALAFTRGHPLALALVADVSAQRPFSVAEAPEVVKALLRGLVETVPSPLHRLALEGSALVLSMTEPLLAALLDQPDAGGLFEWLRGLSVIELGPRGLFPHDLVRDVLASELRWRDPPAHAALHRRAAVYYRGQFDRADPQARMDLLLDFVYLYRDRSVLGPFLGPVRGGPDSRHLWASAPHPGEWPLLSEWVARHEGAASAALFDHWRSRQPGPPRSYGTARAGRWAATCLLNIEQADAADRAADPALAGLPDGLGPGERATFVRFWLEDDAYQQVGEVQTFLAVQLSRTYLTSPGLAWTFLAFADPGFWAGGCAYLDYHRIGRPTSPWPAGPTGCTGTNGGPCRRWPGCRCWPTRGSRRGPALDREKFAQAVKDALRGLGHAEGLRDSPLLEAGLVPGGLGDSERVAALREAITDAAAELEASPRDRRAFRALHHTYLRPAATQQAAADLLGLPMSTFRRHLAEGIERLTDLLWRRARPARGNARCPGLRSVPADRQVVQEDGLCPVVLRAGRVVPRAVPARGSSVDVGRPVGGRARRGGDHGAVLRDQPELQPRRLARSRSPRTRCSRPPRRTPPAPAGCSGSTL